MSDRHITDEEIHGASGKAPKMPVGVPKATCLNCFQEYYAFYAQMAHEDCLVEYTERKSYARWLLDFQNFGIGILKSPDVRKFADFSKIISGRQMMTQFLQSDIIVIPSAETGNIVLRKDWYFTDEWNEAGFSNGLR